MSALCQEPTSRRVQGNRWLTRLVTSVREGDEQGVVVIAPDHWGIIAAPIILGRRRPSLKDPNELEALAHRFAPSLPSSPKQLFANVTHRINPEVRRTQLAKPPYNVSSRY